MSDITPTLPSSSGSLPPEGAAAPAARQSRFRGPGLNGEIVLSAQGALPCIATIEFLEVFWGCS